MEDSNQDFDFKNFKPVKTVISKMDAAYQQLETAIEVFFNEGNPVSIHTLGGAAHGILRDLGKKKGIQSNLKDSDLIRPEFRKQWVDAINAHQNFFKHADKDGDKNIEFSKNITDFYLFDAVAMYLKHGGKATYQTNVFIAWFYMQYPNLVKESELKNQAIEINKMMYDSKKTVREILKRFAVEERGGIIVKRFFI